MPSSTDWDAMQSSVTELVSRARAKLSATRVRPRGPRKRLLKPLETGFFALSAAAISFRLGDVAPTKYDGKTEACDKSAAPARLGCEATAPSAMRTIGVRILTLLSQWTTKI